MDVKGFCRHCNLVFPSGLNADGIRLIYHTDASDWVKNGPMFAGTANCPDKGMTFKAKDGVKTWWEEGGREAWAREA